MKKIILIVIISITFSCVSDNESNGINEIADFYGGSISSSIGVNASTEDELQGKFFELKILGVDFDKYFKNNYQIPASNVAYLFHKNLNQSEKSEYDFVRVIMTNKSNEHTFEFSKEILESVENSINIMDATVELITKQDYLGLISTFHLLLSSGLDSTKYVNEQLEIDNQYGKAKGFSLQGFKTTQLEVDKSILNCFRISGVLLREGQNTDFSITVEKNSISKSILGIRYAK